MLAHNQARLFKGTRVEPSRYRRIKHTETTSTLALKNFLKKVNRCSTKFQVKLWKTIWIISFKRLSHSREASTSIPHSRDNHKLRSI